MSPIRPLLATAALSALLLASPARANDWSNAIDVCQGALPSFDGDLRKRPLGIINEGASTAFVNCSIRAPLGQMGGGGTNVSQIILLMTNRSTTAQTVNCTLVDGVAAPFPSFPAVYLPKTSTIQPGAFAVVNWFGFETTAERFRLPNLSCGLPPEVEINIVQMNTEVSEA